MIHHSSEKSLNDQIWSSSNLFKKVEQAPLFFLQSISIHHRRLKVLKLKLTLESSVLRLVGPTPLPNKPILFHFYLAIL